MAQEEDVDEDLRTQPLLDSVRSLVNKERQLAGLHLEDKEWEAEQWRTKFLKLQEETGGICSTNDREDVDRAKMFPARSRYPGDLDDDWDDLQAASKKAGDSYLRKLRRKESIELSRRRIGKLDLEGIVTKLRWLRGFTSIDLSDNSIDDTCLQPLKNLMALRQVRRLDLSRNDLGPSAGKALIESLPRCKDLQVLRLQANVVFSRAPDAGARLGSGLRAAIRAGGCRHLWDLSVTLDDFNSTFFQNAPRKTKKKKAGVPVITGSGRGTSEAVASPALVRQNSADPMNALTFTRAFHPRASGGGLGALLNGDDGDESAGDGGRGGGGGRGRGASGHKGCITSLGLPYARLHPRTVEELATYAIPSLTHLDLSYCYVGPAGAAALARALAGSESDRGERNGTRGRGSRSLRSLKLPHNAVGDSGARAISKALQGNHCLTFLSLASNGIGSVGGGALAAVVGRGGSALDCLDVGDNPLGDVASRLLVAATTAGDGSRSAEGARTGGGGGGDGRACEWAPVRIHGLDRVAGATVATKAVAEKGVETAAEGSDVLVAVQEDVSVQSRDADGLEQAYQLMLDSRFEPPAEQGSSSGVSETDGESTLDIQWSVATSRADTCEWRVVRKRERRPDFSVKEGVGVDGRLAAGHAKGGSDEPRDGYSLIRLRCNGWRKHDLLKIFVGSSDGGAGPVTCCDLTIGLVKREPLSASPMTYGLLWADPGGVNGDVERESTWPEEDGQRSPSSAECAEVAFQMSNHKNLCSATSEQTEARSTRNGFSSASAMHRLRHVQVGHGGRIRASWQAILAASPPKPSGQAFPWGRNASGRRMDGERPARRGYSWAIVRTRGMLGCDGGGQGSQAGEGTNGTCDASCCVILQGSVPDPPTHPNDRCADGVVTDAERGVGRDNSNGKVDVDPSRAPVPSTKSPCYWHSLGVDTTGWLPGDVLSLWMQLDDFMPYPPTSRAASGGWVFDKAAAAPPGVAGREEDQWLDFRSCYRPRVRGFSLRVIDDARAEEVVRRAYCFPRQRPLALGNALVSPRVKVKQEAVATGTIGLAGTRGKTVEAGIDCHFVTAETSTAPGSGVTEVERLDFAAVCPMNMAAAGGSWA